MDKILELIKAQNFDMDDLAKVLNVTKDTLGKMLNGKVTITTSQLDKITNYLNIDLSPEMIKGIKSIAEGSDVKDLLGNVAGFFNKK